MGNLLNLKPLVLIILLNYIVIVFGSYAFYTIQINIERILRHSPKPLVGFIQVVIGSALILLWIFIWIKLYKLLFLREMSRDERGTKLNREMSFSET